MRQLTFLVLALFFTFDGWALSFTVDSISYSTTGTNTVEVDRREYTGDIIIPSSVDYSNNTYTVTAIGMSAFHSCAAVTSVTIPSSVTSIGDYSFRSCPGVIIVDTGNTKYASKDGILYNKKLTTLFHSPTSLAGNFTIPSSVTIIEDYAFSDCAGLSSITIPSSVTIIGMAAFGRCPGLITVDSSNTKYASKDGVLYDKKLTTLIQCPMSFTGHFTIPSSVTLIGSLAFLGCTGITSVTIPTSMTRLGGFSELTGLTSITIPSSVTKIHNEAFKGCIGLTTITIPTSVTSIGYSAFSGCTGLTDITIPSSITSIGYSAFTGCTGLTSMTIPSLVTRIESATFEDCTGLTSITIPSSVTSIGTNAFKGCTGLSSVTIPSSVTSIELGAFYGCTGLALITIPPSVTTIGWHAFYNCTGSSSITIPSSVTSIGYFAFGRCSGLITVDSSNTKYASKDGILYDKNLTTLIQCPVSVKGDLSIPPSVTTIKNEAFCACSDLTAIELPSTLNTIEQCVFMYCSSLSSIIVHATIPPGLGGSVFFRVDTTKCKLYVPIGSLSAYQAANQWKDFVTILELGSTGISDVNRTKLSIYPNPTQAQVTIELGEPSDNVQLILFNAHGQMVCECQTYNGCISLDVSHFPAGVYFIDVKGENNQRRGVGKFIRQ